MEVLKSIYHWLTHGNETPLGTLIIGGIGVVIGILRLKIIEYIKKAIPKIKDFNSKHIKRDKKLNALEFVNVSIRIQKGQKVEKWEKRAYDKQMERLKKLDEETKKREA